MFSTRTLASALCLRYMRECYIMRVCVYMYEGVLMFYWFERLCCYIGLHSYQPLLEEDGNHHMLNFLISYVKEN